MEIRGLDLTPDKIFTNCSRVCKKHFIETDFVANNKLGRHAIPSLYLPEFASDERGSLVSIPSQSSEVTTLSDCYSDNPIVIVDESVTPQTDLECLLPQHSLISLMNQTHAI